MLFTDGAGRVLLVEPTYKPVWEVPGGVVERDESPRDGAAREVKEELSLAIVPGRLLAMDWVPPLDGRAEGYGFVYDGGRLTPDVVDSITLAPTELQTWAWCTIAEAKQCMRPLAARRLRAAHAAAVTGGTLAELENGYPVGTAPAR